MNFPFDFAVQEHVRKENEFHRLRSVSEESCVLALLVKSSKHLLDCFTLFSSSPLFLCCPEMNYLIFEFQVFGQPLLVIHFLTGCVLCFSCCAVVVELLSCVQLFATPWTAAPQASLSFIISQSLLKLMSIESVMPSNHLILCCPLLILPSIFPSIRVFSNVSALCIRWPKYWSFSFSISPSNEYSRLLSFRVNWFDLLDVQGTLKSLLQHHSLKTSILPRWVGHTTGQ